MKVCKREGGRDVEDIVAVTTRKKKKEDEAETRQGNNINVTNMTHLVVVVQGHCVEDGTVVLSVWSLHQLLQFRQAFFFFS